MDRKEADLHFKRCVDSGLLVLNTKEAADDDKEETKDGEEDGKEETKDGEDDGKEETKDGEDDDEEETKDGGDIRISPIGESPLYFRQCTL